MSRRGLHDNKPGADLLRTSSSGSSRSSSSSSSKTTSLYGRNYELNSDGALLRTASEASVKTGSLKLKHEGNNSPRVQVIALQVPKASILPDVADRHSGRQSSRALNQHQQERPMTAPTSSSAYRNKKDASTNAKTLNQRRGLSKNTKDMLNFDPEPVEALAQIALREKTELVPVSILAQIQKEREREKQEHRKAKAAARAASKRAKTEFEQDESKTVNFDDMSDDNGDLGEPKKSIEPGSVKPKFSTISLNNSRRAFKHKLRDSLADGLVKMCRIHSDLHHEATRKEETLTRLCNQMEELLVLAGKRTESAFVGVSASIVARREELMAEGHKINTKVKDVEEDYQKLKRRLRKAEDSHLEYKSALKTEEETVDRVILERKELEKLLAQLTDLNKRTHAKLTSKISSLILRREKIEAALEERRIQVGLHKESVKIEEKITKGLEKWNNDLGNGVEVMSPSMEGCIQAKGLVEQVLTIVAVDVDADKRSVIVDTPHRPAPLHSPKFRAKLLASGPTSPLGFTSLASGKTSSADELSKKVQNLKDKERWLRQKYITVTTKALVERVLHLKEALGIGEDSSEQLSTDPMFAIDSTFEALIKINPLTTSVPALPLVASTNGSEERAGGNLTHSGIVSSRESSARSVLDASKLCSLARKIVDEVVNRAIQHALSAHDDLSFSGKSTASTTVIEAECLQASVLEPLASDSPKQDVAIENAAEQASNSTASALETSNQAKDSTNEKTPTEGSSEVTIPTSSDDSSISHPSKSVEIPTDTAKEELNSFDDIPQENKIEVADNAADFGTTSRSTADPSSDNPQNALETVEPGPVSSVRSIDGPKDTNYMDNVQSSDSSRKSSDACDEEQSPSESDSSTEEKGSSVALDDETPKSQITEGSSALSSDPDQVDNKHPMIAEEKNQHGVSSDHEDSSSSTEGKTISENIIENEGEVATMESTPTHPKNMNEEIDLSEGAETTKVSVEAGNRDGVTSEPTDGSSSASVDRNPTEETTVVSNAQNDSAAYSSTEILETNVQKTEDSTEVSNTENNSAADSSAEVAETDVQKTEETTEASTVQNDSAADSSTEVVETDVQKTEETTEVSDAQNNSAADSSTEVAETDVQKTEDTTEVSNTENNSAVDSSTEVAETDVQKTEDSKEVQSDSAADSSAEVAETDVSKTEDTTEVSTVQNYSAADSSAEVVETDVSKTEETTEVSDAQNNSAADSLSEVAETDIQKTEETTEVSNTENNSAVDSSAEVAETDVQKTEDTTEVSDAQNNSAADSSSEVAETDIQKTEETTEVSTVQNDSVADSSTEVAETDVQKTEETTEVSNTENDSAVDSSAEVTETDVQKTEDTTEASDAQNDAAADSSTEVVETDVQKTEDTTEASDAQNDAAADSSTEVVETDVQKTEETTEASDAQNDAAADSSTEVVETDVQKTEDTTEASNTENDSAVDSSAEVAETDVQKTEETTEASDAQNDAAADSSTEVVETDVQKTEDTTEASDAQNDSAADSSTEVVETDVQKTEDTTEVSNTENDSAVDSSAEVVETDVQKTEDTTEASDAQNDAAADSSTEVVETDVQKTEETTEASDAQNDSAADSSTEVAEINVDKTEETTEVSEAVESSLDEGSQLQVTTASTVAETSHDKGECSPEPHLVAAGIIEPVVASSTVAVEAKDDKTLDFTGEGAKTNVDDNNATEDALLSTGTAASHEHSGEIIEASQVAEPNSEEERAAESMETSPSAERVSPGVTNAVETRSDDKTNEDEETKSEGEQAKAKDEESLDKLDSKQSREVSISSGESNKRFASSEVAEGSESDKPEAPSALVNEEQEKMKRAMEILDNLSLSSGSITSSSPSNSARGSPSEI